MSEETATATETSEATETETTATETTATETAADWRESLPDDLKADPSLASIKDVAGLAKSYVHAQKLVGADKVAIPGRDASPEDVAAFFNKLGRPEKPEGYEWPTENLPEGVGISDDDKSKIGQIAHDIGLNKQQAAKLYRAYAQQIADGQQMIAANFEQQKVEAEQTLRQEWGKAFDQNLSLAINAAKEFGGDDFMQTIEQAGLGNHPAVVKMLARVGRAISEDEVVGGGKSRSFTLSPSEAMSELSRLTASSEFNEALTRDNHPGHAEAVKKRNELYQQAYPEEGA